MRIAFVSICGYPWGGSEVFWTAMAKEALAEGHEVLVSVFDWPNQHKSIPELAKKGAKFVYRRRFYPVFRTRVKKKLLNIILPVGKKITYHNYLNWFKPDHIIFNLAGGDEIASDSDDIMVFIRQTKIPFSVFYHSLALEYIVPEKTKQNFCFLMNKSRNSLFTSSFQVELYEKQLNYKVENKIIINHPLAQTDPCPLSFSNNDTAKLCIIGVLEVRWKGQDTILNILGRDKWLKRKWVLNIYGEGSDLENLKKLCEEYCIIDRVIFHGFDSQIGEALKKNHLVLIPSKQDSGPIVLFEAMFAAKPVVGSYMGSMPEYIIPGETGVLAKSISEKDFEDALETAWINRNKWEEWGRSARLKILEEYNFNSEKTFLKKVVGEFSTPF